MMSLQTKDFIAPGQQIVVHIDSGSHSELGPSGEGPDHKRLPLR